MALPSSERLIAALQKDGFLPRRKSKRGSHQALKKVLPYGSRTVVVPLAKKEIPRGTLQSILRQAGLTEKELQALLK